MKKLIACLCIVCLVGTSLFAVQLTPEQQRTYNMQSLSIGTSQSTTAFSSTSRIGNTGLYLGSTSGKTTTEWIPFQGNVPIDISDFYRITGYPDEAKRYDEAIQYNKRNRTIAWTMIGIGSAACIGGSIMFGLNSYYEKYDIYSGNYVVDQSQKNAYTAGGVIMVTGALTALLGLIPYYLHKDISDLFSVSFAVKIADDYNTNLLNSL